MHQFKAINNKFFFLFFFKKSHSKMNTIYRSSVCNFIPKKIHRYWICSRELAHLVKPIVILVLLSHFGCRWNQQNLEMLLHWVCRLPLMRFFQSERSQIYMFSSSILRIIILLWSYIIPMFSSSSFLFRLFCLTQFC